jgi:uncharacterized protein
MKILLQLLLLFFGLYALLCGFLFLVQEKFIFFPQKLDKNFVFTFNQEFEEKYIETEDGTMLHGILFRADDPQGIILYLHGNAGSLSSWGDVAPTYTDLGYDVFIPDYRGFGKSEGSISNEKQLFEDIQTVYDELKKDYSEDEIVVSGYSIGTGPASKIASANKLRLLILQAPFYSLTDIMKRFYPFVPAFILKYKFRTHEYIKRCEMPVVIFHGNQDELIYYGSSLKLKELFKPQDTLITLSGQQHNGMTYNPDYQTAIRKILAK